MMNIFIPTQKDRFRVLEAIPISMYQYPGFNEIPVGAIISVERVVINKMLKLDSQVSMLLRVVPGDREKTMVRYGGTNSYGASFRLTVAQLREIKVEQVENMP